jgi:hypothetical protein
VRSLWLVGLAAAAAGCGGGPAKVPTVAAEGKVLYRGRPAAGAQVVLVPVGDDSPDAIKPRGTTDANGVFRLKTYPSADGKPDGAPPGEYRVSLRWTARAKRSAADADEGGPPGPPSLQQDRFGERYSNPRTSGLTVKVEPGKPLPPIELK